VSSEAIFVCEGYHDRSFLSGWLTVLGCNDPSNGGKTVVLDPSGKRVAAGQFAFHDPSGKFLRVTPVNSDSQCFRTAETLLKRRATSPIRWLAIVVDVDESSESRRTEFEQLVERLGGTLDSQVTAHLADGTRVCLVGLGEEFESRTGVPRLACLEQLVCSAIAQAYPGRDTTVSGWLSATEMQHSKAESAKAHVWSYMAGWYPSFGCDAFFREIWRHPEVRVKLEEALRRSRAWALVEAIVGEA